MASGLRRQFQVLEPIFDRHGLDAVERCFGPTRANVPIDVRLIGCPCRISGRYFLLLVARDQCVTVEAVTGPMDAPALIRKMIAWTAADFRAAASVGYSLTAPTVTARKVRPVPVESGS
jgi:hypothetical protein